MHYQWDFGFLRTSWPLLLVGLANTLQLAAGSLLAGLLIGLIAGIARGSASRILRYPAACYVEFFRNVPGLILIFWFYYAIPILTGWQSSVWLAAMVSLSLYTGAYCAEIYRAGIESIDRGQWEAGRALGLKRWSQFRDIILPQALRRMIPAFANRAIEVVKTTTLASALAFGDLLYNTKLISEDQLRPLEAYTTVTLIFTAILLPVSYLCFRLERRYAPADGASR